MSRVALVARTMVELADTLVDEFDVIDLLNTLADRCVDVLDVAAAGIVMTSRERGELEVVASSSAAMRAVELFEIQEHEGPCIECLRSGRAVVNEELQQSLDRWPRLAPIAVKHGFHAVDAVPLRLRGTVIGALNLFRTQSTSMTAADVATAQSFADVVTIAILQYRVTADAHVIRAQLEQALNSRIVIEQAKGIVAERQRLDMQESFVRLRNHARNNNQPLVDTATAIVAGTLTTLDMPGQRPR